MMKFWSKTATITLNAKLELSVYQSVKSKLRVAITNVPGPMVRGNITFATETNTNDGLPHTLEHLVFMGSKHYPFKGFLDVIANRCMASGTNASTAQDYTEYSLTTAGSAGFLKVLPVYLDHLLEPMLTGSQYMTEVHHIDGTGKDSGVVYSEMQEHESDLDNLVDRKRRELFYPENSSYAVDTGGRLAEIRTLCSLERVRNYHNHFYHLNNMFITVSGNINHEKLLDAISVVEQRNINRIPTDFVRPFITRLPEIKERFGKVVCPSDDESTGSVQISWRGPPGDDIYKMQALQVLFDYLTATAGAPLKRDFVQLKDPLCSSVHISLLEQTDCEVIASFDDVPTDKLELIHERFFSKSVADHVDLLKFDMQRMGYVIDQQSRSFLLKLENNPHSLIKEAVIGHLLYSKDGNSHFDLEERLNEIAAYKKLKAEPAEFWHKLFHECFTKKCVCVEGYPSEQAVAENMKEEEKRVEAQVKKLGAEWLRNKEQRLSEAIKQNTSITPSSADLADLIVRDFEDFKIIPVTTSVGEDFQPKLPFCVFGHQVNSDFYEANILIDTQNLNKDDRRFLLLWAELIFQSGGVYDGKELSYEELTKLATRDLVSSSICTGISGVYDRCINLQLRVDAENVGKLAQWGEIFLCKTALDVDRVLACAQKLANKASEYKRDGDSVVHFLSRVFTYEKDSNTRLFDHIAMEKFHKQIAKDINNGKGAKILENVEQLRDNLRASAMSVHFVGDFERTDGFSKAKCAEEWAFLNNTTTPAQFKCSPTDGQSWDLGFGSVRAITVGGSESAFLLRKAQFPGDWNGPTTMEALLLCQYLCQCEGPLWNAIRGTGLAYDASIYVLPDRQSILLYLYRCSQLSQAFKKTKETVMSVLNDGLDEEQFEAAKRSLVCELIGGQSTVKLTAISAILATIRNVGNDFTKNLCSRIWHAKKDEVLKKGSPPLLDLFVQEKSVTSIAMNPARLSDVKGLFTDVKLLKTDELQF